MDFYNLWLFLYISEVDLRLVAHVKKLWVMLKVRSSDPLKKKMSMKSNELKNQTTAQLTKSLNMLKGITGALIIMTIIVLSISIYGLLNRENTTLFIALIAVGTSGSAILTLQFVLMSNIKTELKKKKKER